MIEEFKEILLKLEEWNNKYNKCKDKYLSLIHVEECWICHNEGDDYGTYFSLFVDKEGINNIKKKRR